MEGNNNQQQSAMDDDIVDDDAVFLDEGDMQNAVAIEDGDGDPPSDDDEEDVGGDGGDGMDVDGDGGDGSSGVAHVVRKDDSILLFDDHTDAVLCVACHPSLPLIASGGCDDIAYVWNADTGETRWKLTGHTDSVSAVAFSRDGTLLASAGMDGAVKIWNVESGELMSNLQGPSGGIDWIDWHPKGNVILAGCEDGTSWMWVAVAAKSMDGTCMHVFAGHGDAVRCGQFTPDGRKVVSGSDDETVKIWNPKSGLCTTTLDAHNFHKAGVTTVACSSDNQTLLSGAQDGTVCLSNVTNGKLLNKFSGHPTSVESGAFSARTYNLAATGATDGSIVVWDVTTLQSRITVKHEMSIVKLLWHPEQPVLYSCSVDGTVSLWDGRGGSLVKSLSGHTAPIFDFAIARNGSLVVSASEDTTCRVFRV
eukprot:TRINITY_DN14666_c0_g1_i1.p1 TRINITY_DN14666_c0_g1~~TRINITY_DN14666_c0_g1_i1.p1  ORF type:complete len:421 (+),score=71.71 TRINITY_DN14666_c0_g1_i1:28-1290(+)